MATPESPLVEIPIAPPPRDPPWGIFDILAVILFGIVTETVLVFAALALFPHLPAFHDAKREEILANALFLVPVQALTYLLALLFARMWITLRAQNDFWKAVRWNLLPAAEMMTFALGGVVLALLTQLLGRFLPIPDKLPMDRFFTTPTSIYLMMAFGTLIAPLIEELLFRGLIFPVVVRHLGIASGLAVTAMLFALIHQPQLAGAWAPLLLLFFVGIILTSIRAMTKSVAASWITHLSYNSTLFAILYYATSGLKHLDRL